MPNTPSLYGAGASAFCINQAATREDARDIELFMNAVGIVFQVNENQIDAVTGVSGSGPAYVFMFIEALADGGVK